MEKYPNEARLEKWLDTIPKEEKPPFVFEFMGPYKPEPVVVEPQIVLSPMQRLDHRSWQLMQAGKPKEAMQLLMGAYPFEGNKTLLFRLSELNAQHPDILSTAQKNQLLTPFSTPELRQLQASLSWFANDCAAITNLLDDFSPQYNAATWQVLGDCYSKTLPGLALHAYEQALERDPSSYHHRAVAYQAYEVRDYEKALTAWQAVPTEVMSDEDLQAATQTAQAANHSAARDSWLSEQKKRGMDHTEHYWWLTAQRYREEQPELALSSLDRAILAEPTVRAYASRSALYRQQDRLDEAIHDLNQAILLDPDNRELQAALGYALWEKEDFWAAKQAHEKALEAMPNDVELLKQLAYVSERLDEVPPTQHYARQVIDSLYETAEIAPLSLEQNQTLFDFRRLHEEVARQWTFNADASMGLNANSIGAADPTVGGSPNKSYRSFGQMELDYRLGRNQLIEGDLLSVYGRVFADAGEAKNMVPTKNPMLGVGVRWKPLRDRVFFLAVEQQQPLSHNGHSDTLVRASASFLNGGRFSDDWHPNGKGWLAQNVYLDAAYYLKHNIRSWTADYRVSWHHKVAEGQTVEPYARLQANSYKDKGSSAQNRQFIGVGTRWNVWLGESKYNAWPHKVSVGLEYQRTLNSSGHIKGDKNNTFFTLGVRW